MVRFSIVAQILIVVFVLLDISLARPPIIFMDEPRNKTRILTNPPREAIVDNTNIVFPEDLTKSKPKTGSISRDDIMSNCTEQMPLCEYAVSYPHEHLKIVLTRNTIYKELFGEDESPEVSNRIGEVDDDIYMCRATSTTIFPKQGLNRNNQWKYIINQDDRDFRQGVRIEQCKNFGLGCDIPGQNPLNLFGYRTYCKQKYIYRRLLSVSGDGMPIPDTFRIPSACCCAYKKNSGRSSIRNFTPAKRSR
ncbi:uncharacterized protein LOC115885648 isoform X3 [Sitophilus oryzae]|uniref:Uncharacterized protein LOC115885648 isoform X3 n=1 Tax=Sitophilus oryzae TaxID=7048 RepID=A0A6J2YAG7_SITOR|nr:uncharacterized protein LOC115885648 isoform X3 [Sitophilus oryzae]